MACKKCKDAPEEKKGAVAKEKAKEKEKDAKKGGKKMPFKISKGIKKSNEMSK